MTNKVRLLARAAGNLTARKLDQEITACEQLVSLHPDNVRHRQRLAELLVRANRTPEAIRELAAIGKSYDDKTFYLKAIAVYKQILKLDPATTEASLALAELYAKQGAAGDARAAYRQLLHDHEQAGAYGEALRVLERLAALDQDDAGLRLELAETALLGELRERAYGEFLQAALLLHRNRDAAALLRVTERVRDAIPERTNFYVDLAQESLGSGGTETAVSLLRELLERDPANEAAWFMLVKAYDACGDRESAKDTCSLLTILYPDNPTVRENYIAHLMADGNTEAALAQLEACLKLFTGETAAPFEALFREILRSRREVEAATEETDSERDGTVEVTFSWDD